MSGSERGNSRAAHAYDRSYYLLYDELSTMLPPRELLRATRVTPWLRESHGVLSRNFARTWRRVVDDECKRMTGMTSAELFEGIPPNSVALSVKTLMRLYLAGKVLPGEWTIKCGDEYAPVLKSRFEAAKWTTDDWSPRYILPSVACFHKGRATVSIMRFRVFRPVVQYSKFGWDPVARILHVSRPNVILDGTWPSQGYQSIDGTHPYPLGSSRHYAYAAGFEKVECVKKDPTDVSVAIAM